MGGVALQEKKLELMILTPMRNIGLMTSNKCPPVCAQAHLPVWPGEGGGKTS